jgi:hypothetical protein
MSDDLRDQLAADLFNDNDSERKRLFRYAYEERIIKRIFAAGGVTPKGGWGRYVNQSRQIIGHPHLSFVWFNQTFSFPGQLCGDRVPYMYKMTPKDFVVPPSKNQYIKRVLRKLLAAQLPGDRQKFVFCFPVVKTMFCLHNLKAHGPESWENDEPRCQTCFYENGSWLFMEKLDTLARGIPPADWFTEE